MKNSNCLVRVSNNYELKVHWWLCQNGYKKFTNLVPGNALKHVMVENQQKKFSEKIICLNITR